MTEKRNIKTKKLMSRLHLRSMIRRIQNSIYGNSPTILLDNAYARINLLKTLQRFGVVDYKELSNG